MALWWIVGLATLVWVLAYGVPDIFFHHLQWGGFSGSRDQSQVALTFDDGPGPDTPAVLDALKRAGVRATFFLVAEQAANDPTTVRRMVEDGHEVGLHMSRHVSAFLLTPWRSYYEVGRGLGQIAAITGQQPRWFRPPWGHMNLGTWMASRRWGLTPVFWNIAPDDWRDDRTSDAIMRYVVDLALPGTVVVLHDAGGARQRTVAALPEMVAGLREMGLEPVTMSQIGADPSFLRRAWTWWEIRFARGGKIQNVPNRAGGTPFLRIGRIRYRGRPARLGNGYVLIRGDSMGEIHFGNPALSQISGRPASGLRALHSMMAALSDLTLWLKAHHEFDGIRAIGGVTLLDAARAVEKLGFTHVPVRGWKKWSMRLYLTVLMAVYHRDGWRTLRRVRRLRPAMLVMDMNTLHERYDQPPEPPKKRVKD